MDHLYLNNLRNMLLSHMPMPHSPIPKPLNLIEENQLELQYRVLCFPFRRGGSDFFLNGTENNRLVYGMFIHMYQTVLSFTWISRRQLWRTLNAENITQSTTPALGYWSFQKTTMAEFQFEANGLQNGLACKSIYISLSTNYCLLVRKAWEREIFIGFLMALFLFRRVSVQERSLTDINYAQEHPG